MTENHANTIRALNKVTDQKGPPPSQFCIKEQVWLDTSHLKLPHQKAKLTPKRLGLFKITQEISPVAYHLELPTSWQIHDVFHTSLLTPYHETQAHSPNFTQPPPDLIDREDEYEVERIVAHRQFGRSKKLQYLIKWKGYPKSDNTWEPADQVHAPELIKHYQSAARHQSAAKLIYQSATPPAYIKTLQVNLQNSIECPTIFPASLSNASQRTSPLKTSPHLNVPNTTSIPQNPAPTVSSTFATSLAQTTSHNTVGIVSSTTVPFTTTIRLCQTTPAMTPPNPLPHLHMEDPLPLLSSIHLLKSSPHHSQPSLAQFHHRRPHYHQPSSRPWKNVSSIGPQHDRHPCPRC